MSDYYVDSRNGDDGNAGDEAGPWQSLGRIDMGGLQPGDVVNLKWGSDWAAGGFDISCEGVTFQPYGDGAADTAPVIRFADDPPQWSQAVRITGDNNTLAGVLVRDAHEIGVFVQGHNNTVVNVEVTNVGMGVLVQGGTGNVIDACYVHDLLNVVSDGVSDYGAVGFQAQDGASGNEVKNCRFINCKAPSTAFGEDGGVVEFFGPDVHDNNIHHCYAEDCGGVYEFGSRADTGHVQRGNKITHCVLVNNGLVGGIHMDGTFGVTVEDFRFEHCTVYESDPAEELILFWFGSPSAGTMTARNNIFWTDSLPIAREDGFTHSHNVYWRPDRGTLGLALGDGEVNADPLFVDRAGFDFTLQSDSPAIGRGLDLGYSTDYDGNPVTAPVECGAYQYVLGDPGTGGDGITEELIAVIVNLRVLSGAIDRQADALSAIVTDLEELDAQADALAAQAKALADDITT